MLKGEKHKTMKFYKIKLCLPFANNHAHIIIFFTMVYYFKYHTFYLFYIKRDRCINRILSFNFF